MLLFVLRAMVGNILRSMLLMFYSSMEREGLCLKDICVSHMSRQLPKNRNFKVLKNKAVVEISTHLQ